VSGLSGFCHAEVRSISYKKEILPVGQDDKMQKTCQAFGESFVLLGLGHGLQIRASERIVTDEIFSRKDAKAQR